MQGLVLNPGPDFAYFTELDFHLMERPVIGIFPAKGSPAIILPELEADWGEFVVVSQSPPATVDNTDGTKTTSQVIDARLFAPGEFSTPPTPITVVDGSGGLGEVIAPPAPIVVTSVLVEGDTNLRDIKPQAELPYSNPLPWIVGGC